MSTLRQKRYRRFLFTVAELSEKAAQLLPQIRDVELRWRSGQISEAEVAAEYILVFLKIFRPRDYLGGPHNQNLSDTSIPQQPSLPAPSLPPSIAIFAKHSLRSCPLAVNRSLVAWAQGSYKLKLLAHIPDAQTLLRFQTAGERIVTCLFKPEELTNWVQDARDPLGFVMHDLIHADHFFRDPCLAAQQVEFYRAVQARYAKGEFTSRLTEDPAFRERFEYIISDMNSHPAHLEQTLQMALLGAASTKSL